MKTALRIAAYVVLAMLVGVVNVVAAGLLYLHTDHARRTVLSLGLRKLAPVFPGGLSLGGSAGRLTDRVVLTDLVLHDLDGRPAVVVDRLDLDYSLVALIGTRVQIDRLQVEGLHVIRQPLADGRDNLSTMAVIAKPLPALPRALPVSVAIVELAVDARYSQGRHDVRAQLSAAAQLSHGMVASVQVRVTGDTEQLRQQLPNVELRGPLTVVFKVDGPLDDLAASLTADTLEPRVAVRASGHVFADRVALESLLITAPFTRAQADGVYRFDQTGEVSLSLVSSDLRPLQKLGVPKLAGALKLDATAHRDAQGFAGKARGDVRELRAAGNRIGHMTLDVDLADLVGHARVDARRLRLGKVVLDKARVDARGSKSRVQVALAARGPEGLALDFAARGIPRLSQSALVGLDATIERLRVRAGGTPWHQDAPARVSVDFVARRYALSPFGLSNQKQHLTVEGRLVKRSLEGVHVKLEHFDLSQLPAILSPGHALVHTDLQVEIEAHGPLAQPTVGVTWNGRADGRSRRDLIRFTTTGEGRLAKGRLNAKAFVTIGGQKASAKVDMPMPLRPAQPIDISFDASVLLNPWFADLLVPKAIQTQPIILFRLGAKVTAQGSVSGTTSDPKINASARVARFGAASSHGNFAVSIEYRRQKLSASSTLTLSPYLQGLGKRSGIVEATAELPVDLVPFFTGRAGQAFNKQAAWKAQLNLKHVEIERLPWEALDLVPVVRHGWVDASVELAGSFAHPKATVKLDATGLDIGGVTDVAAAGNAKVDGLATTADLRVSIRGSDAVILRGTLSDAKGWRQSRIAAKIETPGFELDKLQLFAGVTGRLRGHADITGTLGAPQVDAKLAVNDLKSGATSYEKLVATGTLAKGRGAMKLEAIQTSGATLVAVLAGPIAGGRLAGSLRATRFPIDLQSDLLPNIRTLRGQLDGTVQIAGSAADPKLTGTLAIDHGVMLHADSAISYRDVTAKLVFVDDQLRIERLRMVTGDGGELVGAGTLRLGDRRVEAMVGRLTLLRFPLEWDTTTGLATASLKLDGRRDATSHAFVTELLILEGRVELKDDPASLRLVPMTHLEDVRVGRARPESVAIPLDDKPKTSTAPDPAPVVTIKGPFDVRGAEVDVQLRADVRLTFGSAIPKAKGTLELSPRGKVRLFDQSYDVEWGRLTFGNVSQPIVAMRLGREIEGVRVGVELGGTVRQPTTTFWSESNARAPAEVASLITGQRREKDRVSTKKLDKKIAGPISNLIVVAFRQSDPDAKSVDVAKPQPSPLKTDSKRE